MSAISPMLSAMARGFAVDQPSFEAGYQAAIAGSRCACPAGLDPYSYFLGRNAAGRRAR